METLVKEDMGGIHRTLLCQGPVKLTRGTKTNKRHLSLFNDVLVVSSNLNKKKFKIKCIIPLNNLYAVENVDLGRNNETSPCKSLSLFWRDGSFLASFRSIKQKDHWYYYLRRSIDATKKDVTKPFTLRIFTEDIETCDSFSQPLCVTATNIDTVNDIIQKLLPMIRMPNSKDYQLWFCPGHEEAPRALQGYEYPRKILMTHLQTTFRTSNSKMSTAFPILPGLFVKDLNVDTEGKFVLKPQYSARSQQQDEKERPCKEERPFMTSCFHRGSMLHQDQMCTVPTVNTQGKLFGKELSSICVDGKWPTAILDILSCLREKGPTTEYIFFFSLNENSCKALKDKLDSGQEVDLKNISVHDVAWILKEFLRNIKGSLMTSRLYDKWLAVPIIGNDEEKLGAVQSLVEQLPEPNAALLGQIFRILHEISKNSSTNFMNSTSLSIEIAPCILWIPSYYSKVLSNFTTEKISLVKFLIDNSPKIFGVDNVAVWYETSFYHPQVTSYKNNPSIINNINQTENELSGCPSGRTYIPGQYVLPKRPVATLQCETSIENQEGKVDTSQEEISPTPPTPVKKQVFCKFPPIAHLERMLPSPILDMLSTIAERGQNSNEVFRFISKNSHCSLRDKIYTKQQINWNEECVLTVASVLKDLIGNIKGSLLSSDLYENWISVLDEKSLLGKIAAIQSILLKMPQANRLLLKELIRVLVKIKTSTMNHLDTFILSVRIAPHVLWDPTCPTSYFGWDLSKKISIIEIMIDNYVDIFGDEDHIICDHN